MKSSMRSRKNKRLRPLFLCMKNDCCFVLCKDFAQPREAKKGSGAVAPSYLPDREKQVTLLCTGRRRFATVSSDVCDTTRQVTLRSLTTFFINASRWRTLGRLPQTLPEGFHPSDSQLRFAPVSSELALTQEKSNFPLFSSELTATFSGRIIEIVVFIYGAMLRNFRGRIPRIL